ncbi:hypothetical protein DYB36_009019 [Aphanomyces astaci]|uniref:DOT1 domain-containing protein n=2 Tax=Aphanomyces astaci TaxID=112090 RepID=A0A396ZS98_APHAT|nr:hypothetical protein DYB36_009019 [Aphanomyces astaci]
MANLKDLRFRVASSAGSLSAQIFHIAGHLHRHGVITGIGKALLKGRYPPDNRVSNQQHECVVEIVFQKDVRGPKLVDSLLTSSDEHWLKFLHRLIGSFPVSFLVIHDPVDVETLKLFDSLYLDCGLEHGKAISRQEREDNDMLNQKVSTSHSYHPGWTFVDLGSGTGRAVFIARLNFDFSRYCACPSYVHKHDSRCTGIEILRGLHDAAADVCSNYNEFVRSVISTTRSPLDASFFHSSLLDLDWAHADVCFANSTCFDSTLIAEMADKAANMRSGSYLITFTKPLPPDTPFDIIDKERRKMSWGPATVYIHQRR